MAIAWSLWSGGVIELVHFKRTVITESIDHDMRMGELRFDSVQIFTFGNGVYTHRFEHVRHCQGQSLAQRVLGVIYNRELGSHVVSAMAPMAFLIRSINGLLPTAILSVHRLSRLASISSKAV